MEFIIIALLLLLVGLSASMCSGGVSVPNLEAKDVALYKSREDCINDFLVHYPEATEYELMEYVEMVEEEESIRFTRDGGVVWECDYKEKKHGPKE